MGLVKRVSWQVGGKNVSARIPAQMSERAWEQAKWLTGALCEQLGFRGCVQGCCCASGGGWDCISAVLFVEGMVNGGVK